MLYMLEANQSDPDDPSPFYASTVWEAPAHRRGKVPADVLQSVESWAWQTVGPDPAGGMRAVDVSVSHYMPARFGYAPGRSGHGVASVLAEWTIPATGPRP